MHFMDIPKGMAKRQSTFDWQTAQTNPLLHNNNNNNKNMIVWLYYVLTMTITTTTTQIVIKDVTVSLMIYYNYL